MKSAIYINEGTTQVVLTPENEWEKSAIKMIANSKGQDVLTYYGQFYECQGGWFRQPAYYNGRSSYQGNSVDDSLIFRIDKKEPPRGGKSVSAAIEVARTPEILLAHVDGLLDAARTGRERLYQTFVEISIGLLDVKKSEAWKLRSHSWDGYIKSCESRFGKGRSALYGHVSCAEQLLPYVSQKQLVSMGVSKALPLAAMVKKTHKRPSDELIEAATNSEVSVESFRATIARETHQPVEKGKWREIGFFASDEEYAEIERAFTYARQMDNIDENLPAPIVQLRTILALAREAISSWGPILEKK